MSKAFLGIDVSKSELVVALLKDNYTFSKNKFTNDPKGFKRLVKWLNKQRVNVVKICMESTGHYSTVIADFLYMKSYKVYVINPICIKSFAKSKLSRTKTDEEDAEIIAEFISKIDSIAYKPMSPESREVRCMYRCIIDLKKQHADVINHLENEALLPKAVCTVWKKLKRHLETQIEILEMSIEALLIKSKELFQHFKNLQTIPGIGKTTAIAILAEMPDISSFKSARQLAAYAGLVPQHKVSGSSIRGRSKLSKLGSSKLRKAMYFPAITAKKHNPLFENFCKNMQNKGKPAMVIVGAIMRKLIHIIFGVMKNNATFDPNILQKTKI